MLQTAPNLTDQLYDALVDEICDGRLAPGVHLVQENLAARFGVSRQPIQQVMTRLKADGMVVQSGKRGLFVAPLDLARMRDHYGVRAALDGWAARTACLRIVSEPALADDVRERGRAILRAGEDAVAAGDIAEQVRCDQAFHFMIYDVSGNAMIAGAAEPHWRFLRRAMGDVLRKAQTPETIWRQHGAILDALFAGDATIAEHRALDHIDGAAERLAAVLGGAGSTKVAP